LKATSCIHGVGLTQRTFDIWLRRTAYLERFVDDDNERVKTALIKATDTGIVSFRVSGQPRGHLIYKKRRTAYLERFLDDHNERRRDCFD